MERALAERHGKPADRDPTLGPIAESDSPVAGLARWLAEGDNVRHLEHEALDPVSPLLGEASQPQPLEHALGQRADHCHH